jgi:hypothetical protein
MKATERMIDSVWTVEYEVVGENEAKILAFNREDPEGYEKERELPRCNLAEAGDRTVVGLTISPYESFRYGASMTYPESKFYKVVNPKYIFSYR